VTSKHSSLEAYGYYGYNGGIPNATTSFHAHLDTGIFGYPVYEFNESDGVRNWKGIEPSPLNITTGDWTFSVDLHPTGVGTKVFGGWYYTKVGGTTLDFHNGQYTLNPSVAYSWKRLSAQVPLPADADLNKYISFYIYSYGFTTNSILYMRNPKIEKGNTASDWTSAPEDIENIITEIQETLGNMANDNLLDFQERQVIKDKLTDVI
jgi:hypothetical protein